MIRLAVPFALVAVLGGCAAHRVSVEGLRPRAAEAIDPRVPLPAEPIAGPADTTLAGRIAAAEVQARAGASAFEAAYPAASAAAARAGAQGSESWIDAEEQLSALVGARAPLTQALADLDAIGGATIETVGDIAVADRQQLFEATSRVAAIDADERARIDRLRSQLAR